MSIAIAGVFPPLRSGIADYTVELARALAKRRPIVLYGEDGAEAAVPADLGEVRPVSELARSERLHDAVLFQIGNHAAHAHLYDLVRSLGAVVDLHDGTLYDLTAARFQDRPWAFARELLRNEGLSGVARGLAQTPPPTEPGRANPRARLSWALSRSDRRRELFPLDRALLRGARAVIVHSPFLGRRIRERAPGVEVVHIPHGVRDDFPSLERGAARRMLGFDGRGIAAEAFVMLGFGLIQRHKRISSLLRALRVLLDRGVDAHAVLLGPRSAEYDVDRDVKAFELGGRAHVADGFPPIDEVAHWIQAADVGVNLRGPSSGGTSGALLKMMALGLCTIATAVPEWSHLAPDALCFVAADGCEVERLAAELGRLAADRPRREAIGARAREHIARDGFLWPDVARGYEAVLLGSPSG